MFNGSRWYRSTIPGRPATLRLKLYIKGLVALFAPRAHFSPRFSSFSPEEKLNATPSRVCTITYRRLSAPSPASQRYTTTDRQTDRHRHEEQPSRTSAQPSPRPPVFSVDARLRRGTARGVGVDVVVGVGVGVMPGASHHRRRQRASRPSVASSRQASIKPRAVERVDPPPGIGLPIAISSHDKDGFYVVRARCFPTCTSGSEGLKPPGGERKSERARERGTEREGKMERAAGSIAIRTDG